MKIKKTILSMLMCLSLILTSFGTAFADGTTALQKDENGIYLIDTADKLFAFAELAKTTAEEDKAAGTARTTLGAKLTEDINLNPGATFTYDHETGLVTVANGDKSCKMGSGMKDTELGNFHPVYNGLCTWDEWNNKSLTTEQREKFQNELIAQMDKKVEALGLIKWTPIGAVYPYIGTFDGNGHTIDGLYINDSNIKYTGLFGALNDVSGSNADGKLQNLTIGENSLIVGYDSSTYGATGAFVGKVGFSTVSDCTNNATVVGKGNYYSWIHDTVTHGRIVYGQVGGIAGISFGRIQNCVNHGTIVSLESAGGIVGNVLGYNNRDNSVAYCINYGNIYSGTEEDNIGRAGGIAVNVGCTGGDVQFTKPVEACTNFGYVEGGKASGIVQTSSNGAAAESILYCANRGTVSGSLSASGIVDYIDNETGSFVMEGCYNAGVVSMLSDNAAQKAYPIASGIHTYSTTGGVRAHTIKNCYNDKTVCPAEDDELFGTYITFQNCFSVPTELFATGEPAYKMGSYNNKGWKQDIAAPETYPRTDGTKRVYELSHYCCHTDKAHKNVFYSNIYGDITDEHNPNKNGICEHCGIDVRKPIFLLDILPETKVGKSYSVTIRLDDSVPMVNGNITVNETNNTEYDFGNGLTGKADYSYYSKYYYYISGIPTKAGELTFTLSATNDNGTTKKTYTLKINEADPLEITTEERLENKTVGEGYWRKLLTNSAFESTWSLAEGSSLPAGLTLSADGIISGTLETEGTYTFAVVASVGGQSVTKTFTLVVFGEGGCKHNDKTLFKGTPATCQKDGIEDYYHCNICDCDIDKDGNEIWNTDNLKIASNHSDKDKDDKCDFCGKNMPIFKKAANESDIVYGGTYILVTQIDGEYYSLAIPPEGKYGPSYDNYMNLCKISPKPDGNFDFSELEANNAIMLKTEFAAEGGNLDAGTPRYGLSSVFDGKRYGLSDGSACFEMYANEPAKYGYRITFDTTTDAAVLGSVYQEWWSTPETAENGRLRAFDMTYNGENIKFMSFFGQNRYKGENGLYKGAEMTEYPIYLYRMTDVGTTSGGITFISNDSNGTVSKTNEVMEILSLTDDANLSNANGISNAVNQTAVEAAIEAVGAVPESVTARIYADITAKAATAETDEKGGKTPTSVTYSVTPKIDIMDSAGNVLSTSEISDSDLNGAPITVTLHTGGIDYPEQIIHCKNDGSKEYFYISWSEQAQNGAKTFEYECGFVTFTITDFSEIKILATAEPEDNTKNSLSYDGSKLTATVDEDGSYTVIFAGYNGRQLSYLATSSNIFKTGKNVFEIPKNVDISKADRIYLWKDLLTLYPVCDAFDIN